MCMSCPVHGTRPFTEFICWGKDRPEPPDLCPDEVLAEHVLNCHDELGVATEWWFHRPCHTWFVAVRDVAHGRLVGTLLSAPGSTESAGALTSCA